MEQIFVSYSSRDTETIDRLANNLRAAGYEIWLDRDNIPGGSLYPKEIVEAIKKADICLIALSPNSVASEEVRTELYLAHNAKKTIIGVEINRTDIPSTMQYPFAARETVTLASDFEAGMRKLLESLRKASGDRVDSYVREHEDEPEKVGRYFDEKIRELHERGNRIQKEVSVTLDQERELREQQTMLAKRNSKSLVLTMRLIEEKVQELQRKRTLLGDEQDKSMKELPSLMEKYAKYREAISERMRRLNDEATSILDRIKW